MTIGTAMTTVGGTTTMTTPGAGMVAGGDGGVMTTMTMIRSSSSPLCKDCGRQPVVPDHERCQDCLVRVARPKA